MISEWVKAWIFSWVGWLLAPVPKNTKNAIAHRYAGENDMSIMYLPGSFASASDVVSKAMDMRRKTGTTVHVFDYSFGCRDIETEMECLNAAVDAFQKIRGRVALWGDGIGANVALFLAMTQTRVKLVVAEDPLASLFSCTDIHLGALMCRLGIDFFPAREWIRHATCPVYIISTFEQAMFQKNHVSVLKGNCPAAREINFLDGNFEGRLEKLYTELK